VCKVVIEMGLTRGATSFAMAWGQVCVKNYAAIEMNSGESGGTTNDVTPSSVATSLSTSLTTVCPAGGYCKEWTCAVSVCNEPGD
jgi:hypothetical protein